MQKIADKELENITGGEISAWAYVVASAIAIFISGIIEGYTHPKSCNNTP